MNKSNISGLRLPNDDTCKHSVRQLELFAPNPALTEDLFRAYYEARRNKRNTHNALRFELDLEHNIFELSREISERTYSLSKCICFIVDKPVKREIFAAHFRDRVVHHYLIGKLMPIIENQLVYDTYSCRKGKGTLFGVRRMSKFMRQCSNNFTTPAYILKLDIRGFFMNINKNLLYEKVKSLIQRKYAGDDWETLLFLSKTIIKNCPERHCVIKGSRRDWEGLPDNKSLFKTPSDCGLPIGNLTSQVFANLYLNDFDMFVKKQLKCKYYGRYVDDFFIIHQDRSLLLKYIVEVREYLKKEYDLVLHPDKIYLQSVSKGAAFLGVMVKPYRTYIGKRVRGNFFSLIKEKQNVKITNDEQQRKVEASMNSYCGFCIHHKAYRLFGAIVDMMPRDWLQFRSTQLFVV